MGLASTVPQAAIREAQGAIVDVMQRMDKDGELVMME